MPEIGECVYQPGAAATLVVGDSHTWLSGGCGTAYPNWDVDCKVGRKATEGVAVLDEQLRRRHRRVVFDLATNDAADDEGLAEALEAVWGMLRRDKPRQTIAGGRATSRELFLVTTYRLGTYQPTSAPLNARIEAFAAKHPRRVTVIPWGGVLQARPELFGEDNTHLTTAGYALRRAVVRAAVEAAA